MFRGYGGGRAGARGGPGSETGIPPELASRAEAILAEEPPVEVGNVSFSHRSADPRPFTLSRFLAPHWPGLLLALLLVGLETVAMQMGPLLTKIGIDRGIDAGRFDVVLIVSGAYLASVILHAVTSWGRVAWTARIAERLMYELRLRVFSHLQRLSLEFYTRERGGRIMTRMTSDIDALTALFQEGLVNLLVQALTLVVVAAILFSMNAQLALVTIVVVVPVMFVMTLWFRQASDRGYATVRERIADVLTDFQESLSGARIVTAHNRQPRNVRNHRRVVGEYRDANLYTGKLGAIYGPTTEAVGLGGQIAILIIGGRMVLGGTLTIGELTAFVLYLTAFFAPIQQLVQLYNTYQSGKAAVLKLRDLLSEDPAVPEHQEAYDLPPVRGEMRFENVSFAYEPGRPVLRDVSLTVHPGETLALVGPTGAGKSTIAKLVPRFYDVTDGRLTIDGHDIRRVTLSSLRRQVGNVPQEPFLFASTIRENVAFGNPDATDEEILDACRTVGVADLVDRLPDGLDTVCRERGVSLSSGERQLLALTRAFLARPRILILDEATSSLDLLTEARIERALDTVLTGRTAIVIAHRLSTAMRADRIAVIDDGAIAEIGTHAELTARGGRYAAMFEQWMSHATGTEG